MKWLMKYLGIGPIDADDIKGLKVFLALFLAMVATLALMVWVGRTPPSHLIRSGWYNRADGIRVGEVDLRGLHGNFEGYDVGKSEFVVTKAPEGFSDTIGRTFKYGNACPSLNCGD